MLKNSNLAQSRRVHWTETELESWLWSNPILPDGETLLPVLRQRPLSRIVDLLFLDRQRRLVLIEIKNERATRLAVGQVLEYLSKYHDYDVGDLSEDCGRDIRKEYLDVFKEPLATLAEERRVIIAASGFDTPSCVACVYLNHALRGVEVSMIRAVRSDKGFRLESHRAPNLIPARKLAAGMFASSPTGRRLLYVLEGGAAPLAWWIGRIKRTGKLSLPSKRRSVLQRIHRRVVPTEGIEGVDLRDHGTVWQRKSNPRQLSRVLGYVSTAGGELAITVRIRPDKPPAIRSLLRKRFLQDWLPSKASLPSWTALEQELQQSV
jgi:hypothetical protein